MKTWVLIALFLVVPTLVIASAGVNPPPGSQRHLLFTPGLTKNLTFSIFGAERLDVFLTGDLRDYITIHDPMPNGSARAVTLTLELPETLEPGKHISYFYAREASSGGMIGARASIGVVISVLSLYPTPYLEAGLSAGDTAVGERSMATLSLTSWSKVVTPDVWAELVVKDQTGATVVTATSQHVAVPAQGSQTLLVPLETMELKQGRYSVEARIHGAQPNLTAKTSFKVGTLDLTLRDYTKRLTGGKINRFTFTIENLWNQELHDVVATVGLWQLQERTPTARIKGFGRGDFKVYLDLSGLNVSTNTSQDGNITVAYTTPDGEHGEKRLPFTVQVGPEAVPASELQPEELQGAKGFFIPFNSLTLLYVALLVLVVINLFLLWRKNGADEIRPPRLS